MNINDVEIYLTTIYSWKLTFYPSQLPFC